MSWTIFDSDVERLVETAAFLGEQKYDLRVLALIRLALADAWECDEGGPPAGGVAVGRRSALRIEQHR
jgi:hypothetical protein